MKKRILSAFLTLCMVLTMMPAVFAADASELPDPIDGVIQLQEPVTITGNTAYSVPEGVTTLDLNGYTLTVPRLDIQKDTALTITDTSTDKEGKLVSSANIAVVVWDGGSLTVAGGTVENTSENENAIAVFNLDTIKVSGGTVKGSTAIYNTSFNGENDGVKQNIVDGNVYCTVESGTVEGYWAICAFGLGVQEDGSVDNEKVQVTINGGTVNALGDGQALATNASGGIYAGFTFLMTDGTISADDGCGMYLPAIGKTTISGGTVRGNQAIRIAAGELNITGGTIEGTAALEPDTDLVSGGSGGTQGAVVIGKASTGYVGDVKVNISNGATVKNLASEEGKSTPAVVVSDKNMTLDAYKDNSIDVNITDATVEGDVIKVSNLTPDSSTQDGGSTTLSINDSTVTGDVLNQSKDGDLAVSNTAITGNIVNTSTGTLSVEGGDITGNVENQKSGSIVVSDTKVTGSVSNSGTESDAGTVAILGDSTVSGDKTGDGIFVESEADPSVAAVNINTGITYSSLNEAIKNASNNDTIRLVNDTTLTEKVTIDRNITIDGNDKTIKGDTNSTSIYIEILGGTTTLQNLTLSEFGNSVKTNGRNAVIMIPDTLESNTDAKVIADNVTMNKFCRTGFDIRSGNFEIKNSNIDCAATNTENKTLTKAVLAGMGNNAVTGSIINTTITSSNSSYEEWSSSAIEILNNATVSISGSSIDNSQNGIWVDNYWGTTGDANVTISDTDITVSGDAVLIYSKEGREQSASVTISSGNFNGNIAVYDATTNDTITISGGNFSSDVKDFLIPGMTQDEDGDIVIDSTTAVAEVNGIGYVTLTDAIANAGDNDTVRLLSDIKDFTNDGLAAENNPVFLIDKSITIDGNGKTLTAGTFTGTKNPIFGIQNAAASENGVQVTIKKLTIVGNENTGHGINVWAADTATDAARPNVILNNVTVNNCGKTAVTLNNSVVDATNLNTSGNVWGAVNVDDENSMFTLHSGTLAEPNQIWTEVTTGSGSEGPGNISLPDDWKYVLMNKAGDGADDIKYHATTDMTQLGEAYNETTNTVFDTVDRALENANASEDEQTVTVIESADVTDDTTIESNVTLIVNQDVTLGGNLTNEGVIENNGTITGDIANSGTIENNGSITGKVTNTGSGTMLSTVTFNVNPSTAVVTVQDASGTEITGTDNTYRLNIGTYTYNITASGYYPESDSFTVDGTNRTIDVELTRRVGTTTPGVSTYLISVPSNITGGSISVNPTRASRGSIITITVNPDEGYELDTLTVLDNNNNRIDVNQENATRYTFTMPSSRVTVNATFKQSNDPTPSDLPFTDVATNEWYYDAVKYVYENGIMNGTDSTSFSPNNTTTRGMIVTMLHRLEGEPSAEASSFADVPSGQWYTDAVAWAAANDIVNGYSDTEFGPNDSITREQMAAILYRYASFKGYDVTATTSLSDYTDAAQISGYATTAMQWANAEGLITGVTNTELYPTGNATRAQVATIFMRFCENIAK